MTTYSQAKPTGTPTWNDLATPDKEAARAFYHELFGWEYDVSGPEFGGYATARVGDRSTAGIGGNTSPDGQVFPPAWALYFASDNVGADVARAVELGASVMVPPMEVGPFGAMATCHDPNGAEFSFWQAGQHIGSQVTGETGSAAWHELYASDARQARDFYAELLGATAEPMPGGMEYYVLKHGDDQLCGIMQIDLSWGDFKSQWMTYFTVADADATAETVKKLGGKMLGPVDDSPFGRLAAVMDPFGATFKILQPPA